MCVLRNLCLLGHKVVSYVLKEAFFFNVCNYDLCQKVFTYNMRWRSSFIFIRLFKPCLLKRNLSFSIWLLCIVCWESMSHLYIDLSRSFCLVPLIYVLTLILIAHCFNYCSCRISIKIIEWVFMYWFFSLGHTSAYIDLLTMKINCIQCPIW